MSRTFNGSQRAALFLASEGNCESCGVQLEKGWHADHVHPFSAGGYTTTDNGAALKVRRLIREGVQPVAENRWKASVGDANSSEENDATYVLARLKRDQPDLAQQVIEGELSPNAAAIRAGIRKSYFRCRADDPRLAVASMLRHFTREQILAALGVAT